jgi:hypothetical protein
VAADLDADKLKEQTRLSDELTDAVAVVVRDRFSEA